MKIRGLARAGLPVFVLSFCFTAAYAVDYTGGNFDDPFFFEEAQKNSAPSDKLVSADFRASADLQGSLVLEGVLWNVEPERAIISGKIVTVGAKIGGAEVVEINKAGVRMRTNGNEFLLKMDSRRAE